MIYVFPSYQVPMTFHDNLLAVFRGLQSRVCRSRLLSFTFDPSFSIQEMRHKRSFVLSGFNLGLNMDVT